MPIPNPTALPPLSDVPLEAGIAGLPRMLLGDTPTCDPGGLAGLSVRVGLGRERGAVFTFRSPSLAEVSATRTCGGRARGAEVGPSDLTVGGFFGAVDGVVFAARRGVRGERVVRLEARVGLRGGGGRPWGVRSDDIPGRGGYRGEYMG